MTFSPGETVALSTLLVKEMAACAGGAIRPLPRRVPPRRARTETIRPVRKGIRIPDS